MPADAWDDLATLELTGEGTQLAAGLSARLGASERSCLAIAAMTHGILASDDLGARNATGELGGPAIGTVGIVILCPATVRLPS